MKRRLLFSYLSITAFVLLILEIPLGVSYASSVERRLTSDLQHDAFAMAIRSQEPLAVGGSIDVQRGEFQAIVDQYHRKVGGRVVIVDRDGIALADSDR